jgi:tetrahydromethanopterin S-methyltransferase subunit H
LNGPIIVASMFYEGDDLLLDAGKARIDCRKTAERIERIDRLSAQHGIRYILDVEIPSAELASPIIEVVAENTHAEFWISSFSAEMRQIAVGVAIDMGLRGRVYYSTLNFTSDEDEFRAVADMGVKPIIQVFNPENPLPDGYLAKAEELIGEAQKVNMQLSDAVLLPTILDFGSISMALGIVDRLHERHSLRVCIPSIGPVYRWARGYSQDVRRLLLASAMTYTLACGADLLHIGSTKRAGIGFQVVGFVERLEKRKRAFAVS